MQARLVSLLNTLGKVRRLVLYMVISNDIAAYHSSIAFFDTWAQISAEGEGVSSNLSQRPPPPAMLLDNTTVTGSWVATNSSNVTASFDKYGRIINNVTVSMPHAGVFAAARVQQNGILQPEQLAGVGEYSIKASVVSPTLNVLCANVEAAELAPLIYVTWPHARFTNSSDTPGQKLAVLGFDQDIQLQPGQEFLNSTAVDDVFQWGAAYGRQPPVFPMVYRSRPKVLHLLIVAVSNRLQFHHEYICRRERLHLHAYQIFLDNQLHNLPTPVLPFSRL